jgi:hypothetical protein
MGVGVPLWHLGGGGFVVGSWFFVVAVAVVVFVFVFRCDLLGILTLLGI